MSIFSQEWEETEKYNMTQVKLVKDNVYKVSWIPSEFSEVGKLLLIEDENWTVEEVFYNSERPYSYIRHKSAEHNFVRGNWVNVC